MIDSGYNGAELWGRVLEDLKGQMTLASWKSVFLGSSAGLFDGESLDVALVSQSACEWANGRLAGVVARSVADAWGRPVTVRFSAVKGSVIKASDFCEKSEVAPEVADRRRVRWYRIDNVVLDDYMPLMGVRAFAVYSLYCRMSGREGLSWPGYAYVCRTLCIGRSTLAHCNMILEALGLIEIERGNQERSNRYYLLEPEVLTVEMLVRIRERAQVSGLERLVADLDVLLDAEGSPVQDYPSPERGLPQSSPRTTPVPNGDYPSPGSGLEQDRSNKTHEQDIGKESGFADSDVADRLVQIGVARDVALRLIAAHEKDRIMAWAEYTEQQDNLRSPPAFLVVKVKEGAWP